MATTEPFQYEMYAIRSKDGKWFRRKGYGGYGSNWVDDIAQARIFTKTGGARSQIGYYAKNFPEFGVPDLIKLKITELEVLDEAPRIKKATEARQKREARAQVLERQRELQYAQEELTRAQARLKRAQGNQ